MVGGRDDFNFVPAFGEDIVILGGQGTTSVAAVRVSTGAELWRDMSTGDTEGRHPILLNSEYCYYAGRNGLWAADSTTGLEFWSFAVTTAKAPVTARDREVYLLEESGVLHSLRDASVSALWQTSSAVGGDYSNIIATEKYVFVNDRDSGTVRAISAGDGTVVWTQTNVGATFAKTPATALAYDILYPFFKDNGSGTGSVKALDPDSGDELWEAIDTSNGLEYGLIANNVIYFYNTTTSRIRALDVFSGTLLWSMLKPGVKALTAADSSLIVLYDDTVEVYRLSNEFYFAHLADGGGQTTLLALSNNSSDIAVGKAEFFDIAGAPLPLSVEGAGTTVEVAFVIPPNSSTRIQTLGGSFAQRGWARVVSDKPISGDSIFQFSQGGMILNEAGVGDTSVTGEARVFVIRSGSFSTAVAIANPLDESASITLSLLNTVGTEVASQLTLLDAGAQIARFMEEVFGDSMVVDGFEGTLVIRSTIPVVITALRTQGGLQMSSYPAAQPVK